MTGKSRPPLRLAGDPWLGSAVAASLTPELRHALVDVARSPRLLVVAGYDGALTPVTADPEQARTLPDAVRTMRALADLPDTTAAVISGRSLHDLLTLSRLPADVHLIGSHGAEFDSGLAMGLDGEARGLLRKTHAELEALVAKVPGAWLELKPASIAVYVDKIEQLSGRRLLAAVKSGPGSRKGVWCAAGKGLVELAVVPMDKGLALKQLRHRMGATAVVFVGGDHSDELVFPRLTGPDVGVAVGVESTDADFRLPSTLAVPGLLAFLAEERQTWLFGAAATPIERLSMLASGTSVALLTPEAGVVWLCHPGPDSAAIFAELVGGAAAGYFTIRPVRAGLPSTQRYLPGTMTVHTSWPELHVHDYLAANTFPQRTDLVRVVTGSAPAEVVFAPRPDFGRTPIMLEPLEDGLRVIGAGYPIVLVSPGIAWDIEPDGPHEIARAVLSVDPDEPLVLELRCGSADLGPSQGAVKRMESANQSWRDWLSTLTLPRAHRDLVARSALTLRGLCHIETGGIMAAATTSLPGEIGGVRNRDHRYCWLRDGAMTAETLVTLGSTSEAEGYLRWLQRVLRQNPALEYLHPLYTVEGTSPSPEAVVDSLSGYAGSRPVRVGNLANHQVQLDVFGSVVQLVLTLSMAQGALSTGNWRLVQGMTRAVAARWHEPDHGIWGERGLPQQHVYSKVMCWVAIDRAMRLAEAFGRPPESWWAELAESIAQDVLDCGWYSHAHNGLGAYTGAYGSPDLDAAALHVGLSGLIDPTSPRFLATVAAVEAELRSHATVYRYLKDDGLPGVEGGSHLCTAWLIEAYLLVGYRAEAEQLFEQFAGQAGPTGLLPEGYDPVDERSLGNHPQASSHIGLIRCARQLDMA